MLSMPSHTSARRRRTMRSNGSATTMLTVILIAQVGCVYRSRSDPPTPPALGPPARLLSSSWNPQLFGEAIAASIADAELARNGIYVTILLQSRGRSIAWRASQIAACLVRYAGDWSFIELSDATRERVATMAPIVDQRDYRPAMIIPREVAHRQDIFPPTHELETYQDLRRLIVRIPVRTSVQLHPGVYYIRLKPDIGCDMDVIETSEYRIRIGG